MAARRNKVTEEQLDAIEAHLAGTLKRVPLSNDLIVRLRDQIHFPYRERITLRLRDWQRMFLVFGGVMSGMLLLITLARAFFYLVARRELG
ncbi:MAG TPA: hypothetical protein VFO91_13250 [Anaerolineales bacterium]|nr:hypothetical protein [Anaerolineales bacterium]